MRAILLLICAVVWLSQIAYAYDPAVGNRAYPIIGHDLVSDQVVSLEELRGKWVLLEFWASW